MFLNFIKHVKHLHGKVKFRKLPHMRLLL